MTRFDSAGPPKDESTRYLCAAAHLDRQFADDAVREFLSMPSRAIPPSSEVDSTAVLREAVAARTRRRLRDGLLGVLLLVLLLADWRVLLVWLGIAVAFSTGRVARRAGAANAGAATGGGTGPINAATGARRTAAAGAAGAVAAFAVLVPVMLVLLPVYLEEAPRLPTLLPEDDAVRTAAVPALLVLVLGVLLLDRLAVWKLTTVSFRREHFPGQEGVDRWSSEWWVRSLGVAGHQWALDDIDEAAVPAEGTEVVVYRGTRPFVGAGFAYQPWSLALALDPADEDDDEVGEIDLAELYETLSRGLVELGTSPSLSPGHRLSGLAASERVVVSAADLVARLDTPGAAVVLPDRTDRPVTELPRDVVDEVLRQPQEWVRYFRRFRLEAWDQALVLTWYLHLGRDESHLYVEWTPNVLLPAGEEYRRIDSPPRRLRLLWDVLGRALRLPVTVIGRVRHALAPIRVDWSEDQPSPETYGAAHSLRELGAADDVRDYFQLTDVERYTKLVDRQLLRSIGRFLEERGITTTEFMRQATEVADRHVHIEGPVTGTVFIGDRNRVRVGVRGKGD